MHETCVMFRQGIMLHLVVIALVSNQCAWVWEKKESTTRASSAGNDARFMAFWPLGARVSHDRAMQWGHNFWEDGSQSKQVRVRLVGGPR